MLLGVCQLSSSPDGLLHFGMKVMLVNHQSKGALYAPQSKKSQFFFRCIFSQQLAIHTKDILHEDAGKYWGNIGKWKITRINCTCLCSKCCLKKHLFLTHLESHTKFLGDIYINFTKSVPAKLQKSPRSRFRSVNPYDVVTKSHTAQASNGDRKHLLKMCHLMSFLDDFWVDLRHIWLQLAQLGVPACGMSFSLSAQMLLTVRESQTETCLLWKIRLFLVIIDDYVHFRFAGFEDDVVHYGQNVRIKLCPFSESAA